MVNYHYEKEKSRYQDEWDFIWTSFCISFDSGVILWFEECNGRSSTRFLFTNNCGGWRQPYKKWSISDESIAAKKEEILYNFPPKRLYMFLTTKKATFPSLI
jgi:hypothetical protein